MRITPPPQPALSGFEKRVLVGLAEVAVSRNPEVILTTFSLGSCLGVAIYDPVVRVGGLLHAMLPSSSIDLEKAMARPGMFIDTGMPLLIETMEELRGERRNWKVYVAGGAQIIDNSDFFSIGKRNYEALLESLAREHLQIEAEQVGGHVNRTLRLHIATGGLSLKVSGQPKEFPLCNS